jgi:hypothetical protein
MSLWVMTPPVPGPKERDQSGGRPGSALGSAVWPLRLKFVT